MANERSFDKGSSVALKHKNNHLKKPYTKALSLYSPDEDQLDFLLKLNIKRHPTDTRAQGKVLGRCVAKTAQRLSNAT